MTKLADDKTVMPFEIMPDNDKRYQDDIMREILYKQAAYIMCILKKVHIQLEYIAQKRICRYVISG